MLHRLRALVDRRRWRAVWMALGSDSLLAIAFWLGADGRPARHALVAIIDDDAERSAAIEFVESQLPDALREDLFTGMTDWEAGAFDAPQEPTAGKMNDPRRSKGGVDLLRCDAAVTVAVADIGYGHRAFATIILDSLEFRDELVGAAECVVATIRTAEIDRLPARMDWPIAGPAEADDDLE